MALEVQRKDDDLRIALENGARMVSTRNVDNFGRIVIVLTKHLKFERFVISPKSRWRKALRVYQTPYIVELEKDHPDFEETVEIQMNPKKVIALPFDESTPSMSSTQKAKVRRIRTAAHLLNDVETYCCRTCFRKFARKWNLDRHETTCTHHSVNYRCPICMKIYHKPSYFAAHVKSHKEHDEGRSLGLSIEDEPRKASIVIIILIRIIIAISLRPLHQYRIGTDGNPIYGHLLVNGNAQFKYGDESAQPIYDLDFMGISGADANCPIECVTKVSAFYKAVGAELSIVMARPSDAALYPDYTDMGLPPFYCATASGNCAASTPLYLYYSDNADDYYADTQQRSMNSSYTMSLMGTPLCYLWEAITTTTITPVLNETTVAPADTTVTPNDPFNTTVIPEDTTVIPNYPFNTTVVAEDYSNTTVSPEEYLNSTVAVFTTTPNVLDSTNATDNYGNTMTTVIPPTTVIPNQPGGGENSTAPANHSDDDDDKKDFWHRWRWVFIMLGCLLVILLVSICIFAWIMYFMHPSSKVDGGPPTYSSHGSFDLPPRPAQGASVTPFTVGFPTAAY
ncbi:unnamed protein product [Caenorhabditis bovis]|uniref:C2H2-type domain-containing protein n=1 Tax=Caenorhabditis bovis TaxID=2654633 RepID=A0A8S1EAA4_9PELO|nr:unnamed protein product [Caenorhabditis bovis]